VLTGLVRAQVAIFHRAPSFRLLFLSTLASGLGTWLAVVALTIDVFDRTGSAKWVSALLIADFLPAVVIGLLFGPLLDRLSRRGVMIAADLARFAVFVTLPFVGSASAIVVLAGLAGFATGFFRPAVFAGLPNLVSSEDLPSANSLLRTIEYLTTTIGTVIGGVIVSISGPDLAYWINAATFLVSAVFLWGIPAVLLQAAILVSRGHWRDLAEGFALVRRSRALLAVFWAWNLAMLSNAAINVSEVSLAKVSFDAGDLGFGLMWAASGLGLALGSLLAATWLEQRGITIVYTGAMILMAFGAATAAISPNVWVAIWCMALGGAGNGAAVVYNSLLVQRGAPDRLRGRAFTVVMSSNFAVLGAGMVAAGPLTDAFGARWVFGGAAVAAALAATVGGLLVRGTSVHLPELDAEQPRPVSVAS
jgi:MFS family permease